MTKSIATLRLPWWRAAALVPAVAFVALIGIVYSHISTMSPGDQPNSARGAITLGYMIAGAALAIFVMWRAALPRTVLATAAVAGIVFPLTPFAALACLPGFLDRLGARERRTELSKRDRVEAGIAIALVTLTSIAAAVRDATAEAISGSFTMQVISGAVSKTQPHPVPLWVSILSVIVPVGFAVWVGIMRRVVRRGRAAEARTSVLGDEVARRAEREAISREVHDVLGHRLTMLNLQAGALEMQASNDPELAARAAQLRENASHSMTDLRSLLAQLDQSPAPLPLAKLRELIARATGPMDAVTLDLDEHAIASPPARGCAPRHRAGGAHERPQTRSALGVAARSAR